ncbi:MAG: ABC transporter permease, partial [Lachnospiraceae bacterium]|nr:ABC transporter permease [Lachnospiraceae bacterium]
MKSTNSIAGILTAFVVLCVVLTIASRSFLTPNNVLNVFQQISTNFIIAIGMTFIILLGGIDLSVGSTVAFSGLIMGLLMKSLGMPVAVALLIGLVCASAIGFFNGFLITFFKLPPFIATLGTMSIVRGAAYTITGGQPIYTFPQGFAMITGRVAGIPIFTILIMVVLFVIAAYVLKYTKYGRYIYAIGGNENCAKLSGVNVGKVKCIAYVISGFCCGVAAIVLTSRLDSAVPTNADGAELDAIAAVVIGGTSMEGGEGVLVGTIIGALIIGVVANGMNLLNVPQGAQRMVKGMIIVIAVIVD